MFRLTFRNTFLSSFKSNGSIGIYLVVLCMVIIYRSLVFICFSRQYVDSDQAVLWHGTVDFANGIFHETRFYGQPYNTMLEALFAAPLYKLGFQIFWALPIVTTLLAVCPFIFLSASEFFRGNHFTAVSALAILLFLPIEYSFVTSIPRGFVTGLFVVSFAFFFRDSQTKISFLSLGLLTILGYTVNPNSALLSSFLILCALSKNFKFPQFYLFLFIGFLIGGIVHLLLDSFYVKHPEFILQGGYKLDFDVMNILHHLSFIDKFFNHVTPFFWKTGFLILISFVFISTILLFKKLFKEGIICLVITLMLFLTLGFGKINDGSNTVFFPYSRMYLSVPLILVLFLSLIPYKKKYGRLIIMVFLGSVVYFVYHVSILTKPIEPEYLRNEVVIVNKVQNVVDSCRVIRDVAKKERAELIIFSFHYFQDLYNYGCIACFEDFPKTIRPAFERRTWRMIEDSTTIYRNIIIVDLIRNLEGEYPNLSSIPGREGFYLIRNNTLKTFDLLTQLGIDYRKLKYN